MASYRLEVSATAERQIRKLNRADQIRILKAIRKLGGNPWPRGCRKLRGFEDIYRIRVGTYRVIYSVENKRLLILILKVGHRRDIYH